MPTVTPTHHVRIDPRFGFSLLTDHNPERDMFMRLAATGRHREALARINTAAAVCLQHVENREVEMLIRQTGESCRQQAM